MSRRTLVGVAVIVGLIWIFAPIVHKHFKLDRKLSQVEDEVRELSEETEALETELELLQTDPVHVEKVARRLFHKAKEREIIYKIVPPEELEEEMIESPANTRG